MKISASIIFVLSLLIAAFIISGGIYRTETVRAGIVHRVNIITGDISLCTFNEGCKSFSKIQEQQVNIRSSDALLAVYPLTHFRELYPMYKDLSDKELAEALYNKYKERSGINVSKESYFNVIGYAPE